MGYVIFIFFNLLWAATAFVIKLCMGFFYTFSGFCDNIICVLASLVIIIQTWRKLIASCFKEIARNRFHYLCEEGVKNLSLVITAYQTVIRRDRYLDPTPTYDEFL